MNILNPKRKQFVIEKNNCSYIIFEQPTKWIVKSYNSKLCINYHISKEICPVFTSVRKYILDNDTLFY